MTILFQRAFRLDYDAASATQITIPEDETNDFTAYVHDLIKEAMGDKRSRKYLFPDYNTGIKSIVSDITKNHQIDAATNSAAQRLHQIEKEAQKKIQHLDQEIQRGILVLAMIENETQQVFFIIKAEHFDYIDEEKKQKARGLPVKKKIFKSFVCYLENGNPDYAKVSDSNANISAFWSKQFLELDEVHDDAHNTRESFDALDSKIFSRMKKDYPEDYMYLRNATVQYFRSNDEFVLPDYVTTIISNYTPADPGLKMQDITDKINSLPEKENFDVRFNIEKKELNKRIINKLRLTDQLTLEIKENINWDTTVQAFEERGVKYIQIRTDEGYKFFKKN